MSGKNFDVFISYRRSDGDAIARILNAEFALRDFRCFLDFDSLGGGKFDEKIEAAILDAPVFVMVLTPDYFSRCNDKGDWVRREIELALANNKIIVPINYDKNLNGIPDYLEEDFRERIGCHNFATVHKDDTFKSSFNQMVEERILNVVGKIVKQSDKAKVSVKADADCELIEDDELIATVQKDKTNFILLEKGEHEIIARSSDYKDIRQEIAKNIDDVSAKYLIKIELADKVQRLKDEETKRLKDEENKRRQEAERIEREKREAERREKERRQREEEARHRRDERERRKKELKAWWERNKSKCVMLLAVIAGAVAGTWCIKNCEGATETATETAVETKTETQTETQIVANEDKFNEYKDSIRQAEEKRQAEIERQKALERKIKEEQERKRQEEERKRQEEEKKKRKEDAYNEYKKKGDYNFNMLLRNPNVNYYKEEAKYNYKRALEYKEDATIRDRYNKLIK